eukprot:2117477-Heterocapsa_arctica.AAC.1
MNHPDVEPREKKDEILAAMDASWVDDGKCRSTSGIAVTARCGLGRIRHLAVKCWWLQEEVCSDNLRIHYVRTTDDNVDILTGELSATKFTILRG